MTPEERVEAGAAWLDENAPAEWWDRVDTENIYMMDGASCILGQVFAGEADLAGITCGYLYVVDFGRKGEECTEGSWAIDHGFVPTSGLGSDHWRAFIERRRAEVAA